MSFEGLGITERTIPETIIATQIRLRIKFMHPRGLNFIKSQIEQARRFPDRPRRTGFTTLPDHLMDIAYELIVEQLEARP